MQGIERRNTLFPAPNGLIRAQTRKWAYPVTFVTFGVTFGR